MMDGCEGICPLHNTHIKNTNQNSQKIPLLLCSQTPTIIKILSTEWNVLVILTVTSCICTSWPDTPDFKQALSCRLFVWDNQHTTNFKLTCTANEIYDSCGMWSLKDCNIALPHTPSNLHLVASTYMLEGAFVMLLSPGT